MGWSSDLESGGDGFDSRLAQVTFGSLLWSGGGHFFVNFGMSWDVSMSGLETLLDVLFFCFFGEMPDEVETFKFQTCLGVFFLGRGSPD